MESQAKDFYNARVYEMHIILIHLKHNFETFVSLNIVCYTDYNLLFRISMG